AEDGLHNFASIETPDTTPPQPEPEPDLFAERVLTVAEEIATATRVLATLDARLTRIATEHGEHSPQYRTVAHYRDQAALIGSGLRMRAHHANTARLPHDQAAQADADIRYWREHNFAPWTEIETAAT